MIGQLLGLLGELVVLEVRGVMRKRVEKLKLANREAEAPVPWTHADAQRVVEISRRAGPLGRAKEDAKWKK